MTDQAKQSPSKNPFLGMDVNAHLEKKNGLSYLSWAWAWTKVLEHDQRACWSLRMWLSNDATSSPVMWVGDTAMVMVNVTIDGLSRECMLPVMDHRNKAISSPDTMQINTAIMRCLVKAIAMHGLGLYVYAGEDYPMDDIIYPETAPIPNSKTVSVDDAFADAPPTPPVKPQKAAKAPPAMVTPEMTKKASEVIYDGATYEPATLKKDEQPVSDLSVRQNAELLCEVMIEMGVKLASNEAVSALLQANSVQLELLKEKQPDLYNGLRNHFKTIRASFSQPV